MKKPKAVKAWAVYEKDTFIAFHSYREDAVEDAHNFRLFGRDNAEVVRIEITPITKRRKKESRHE